MIEAREEQRSSPTTERTAEEVARCPECGAAEPDWDARRATPAIGDMLEEIGQLHARLAAMQAALEHIASLTGGQLPDYARAAHDIARTALNQQQTPDHKPEPSFMEPGQVSSMLARRAKGDWD